MNVTMTARLINIGRWALSFVAGIATAVILHYMLYRIGIPLKPFIYVVF
jgi:hypothetical protein